MNKSYAKKFASVAMLALAAVASQSANAASSSVCGSTAGTVSVNGGSGATSASSTGFFQQGFVVQCSANVILQHDEVSANMYAVAAGSDKGNQTFGGNSNGGAITTKSKCTGTNDACTATNVGAALSASSS